MASAQRRRRRCRRRLERHRRSGHCPRRSQTGCRGVSDTDGCPRRRNSPARHGRAACSSPSAVLTCRCLGVEKFDDAVSGRRRCCRYHCGRRPKGHWRRCRRSIVGRKAELARFSIRRDCRFRRQACSGAMRSSRRLTERRRRSRSVARRVGCRGRRRAIIAGRRHRGGVIAAEAGDPIIADTARSAYRNPPCPRSCLRRQSRRWSL